MPIEFRQSSPQATQARENKERRNGPDPMYPFKELEAGQSFTVPLDECNWKSLRALVYKQNRLYRNGHGEQDREFVFVKHDGLNLAEVARIK